MIGILKVENWTHRIPLHSLSPDIVYNIGKKLGFNIGYVIYPEDLKNKKILINLYPSIYPSSIEKEIINFRNKKGCLITTLPAFEIPMKEKNKNWVSDKRKIANHENLGLPNIKVFHHIDTLKYERNPADIFEKNIKTYKHSWIYLIDTFSLPEEDNFYGVIKCFEEGIFKGFMCGFVKHNCEKWQGIIDFVGFSMERLIVPRPHIERIIFLAISYILKEKDLYQKKWYLKFNNDIKKIHSPFELKIEKKDSNFSLFYKNPPTEKILLVKDSPNSLEEKILFYSIQGFINRTEKEKLYFGEDFLLNLIEKKGIEIENIKKEKVIEKYFEKCSEIKMVLYDENDPLSINIALTYAGVKDCLPVTEKIKRKYNLKGKIVESFIKRFKNKKSGYEWARKNLLPLCSRNLIYHMKHLTTEEEMSGKMVDYLISHRIFSFHIDSDPSDEEIKEAIKILSYINENAIVSGMFYYNNMYHEAELTALLSETGKIMVPCFNLNLTVHSSFTIRDLKQKRRNDIFFDCNKIYICFTFTDGDNMAYILDRFNTDKWWRNKKRGKISLGWTIGPSIYEICPLLLEYFYNTQTEKDNFIFPFGAGYIYWDIFGRLYEEKELDIKKDFCKLTEKYMEKMDIKTINPHHIGTSDYSYDIFSDNIKKLEGIFANYNGHPYPYYKANYYTKGERKIPVFHSFFVCERKPENPVSYLKELYKKLNTFRKPVFAHISLVNWWFTPEDVSNSLSNCKEIEIVSPEEMVILYKYLNKR